MESSETLEIIFLIFNYIIPPRIIAFFAIANYRGIKIIYIKNFFRDVVKGANKRKASPPTPTNTPDDESPPPLKKTPAKKRQQKKERPNIFMTRENFKATSRNEFVVETPDKVNDIRDFRVFFNDEKTRGAVFDYNVFKGKDEKTIRDPTLFVFNHWQEKKENLKNPETDDGKRETAAKLKPRDIDVLVEVCRAAKMLNPRLFDNIPTQSKFNAIQFVKRMLAEEDENSNSLIAEVEELDGDGTNIEETQQL